MKSPDLFLLFFCALFAPRLAAQAPDAFAGLTEHFHRLTDEGRLAGTVIVLEQDDRVWQDVYGFQNVEEGIPMSDRTLFRMASMTKPITSTAVMMLVEEGRLRLDDPVDKYLPAFAEMEILTAEGRREKLRRAIQIEDLLLHTSGITSQMFQQTPAEKAYAEAFRQTHPKNLEEMVDALSALPLAHQPGEGWSYGYSTDVLARIVEIASDRSIDDFFRERIFRPLGMNDTDFQVGSDRLDRFACLYGKELKLVEGADEGSPYVDGRYFPRGVGGLVSTAGDYLRFCRMLLNGGELEGVRILQAKTVALMMQNHLPDGVFPHTPGMPEICHGFGYGFGVQTDDPAFGTPGDCAWPGACLTYFFIDPTHGGIGLLLTQSTDFGNLPMLGVFHEQAGHLFSENRSAAAADE